MDKNNLPQVKTSILVDCRGYEGPAYFAWLVRSRALSQCQAFFRLAIAQFKASELYAKRSLVHDSEWFLFFWLLGTTSLLLARHVPPLNSLLLAAVIAIISIFKIKLARYLAVFILAIFWASWNFQQHWLISLPSELESKSIVVQGFVTDMPRNNTSRSRFRFKVEQILTLEQEVLAPTQHLLGQMIELSCYRCPYDILPQQKWSFTVRLKRPHGYASWGAFDFEKFLFRHQLVARGYVRVKGENHFISEGDWSINKVRWRFKQQLSQQLSGYTVGHGMIAALLIGDKSQLADQHKRTFQATGVSHLMAISGLHVGLVFLFVCQLIKWLLMPFAQIFYRCPRQFIVLPPALLAAFSYSAMAGFAVSTQRAFVMLSVFVVCRLIARDNSLLRVLLIAAGIILMLDPLSILDVGFWLSCGAVFIIALAGLRFKNLTLYQLQPLLWLGMLPMSMAFFGQVSLISPLVNLLMVPLFCSILIPLVLLAFVLSQLGLETPNRILIDSLAQVFEYIYTLLEKLSRLELALIYPTWYSLVFAALMIIGAYAIWRRARAKLTLSAIAFLCLILAFIWSQDEYHKNEVEIALLDVGQGLSMVVQAKDYVLVYDTGPAYQSGFNAAEAVLIPYLRHRGISHIDTLIISHADNDHIGGFAILSETIEVGEIFTSRLDRIPEATLCETGQKWHVGAIKFEIISPQADTPQGSNNLSCVLSISNGTFRALITGDIEKQVERFLLEEGIDLKADFLLVPHQGSKTSSTAKFIDAVDPIIGLIAAGYRNHYGHPHASVVERYTNRSIKLMSTVENGSILLKFNGKDWAINTFREQEKGFWHRQKMPN